MSKDVWISKRWQLRTVTRSSSQSSHQVARKRALKLEDKRVVSCRASKRNRLFARWCETFREFIMMVRILIINFLLINNSSTGVWEVSSSPIHPLIATASADHTSCIWNINSGKCLLKYEGHTGSVNSIKFHPSKDMMLSSSGDNSAHIWQGAVNFESSSRRGHSSEEELEDDLDETRDEKERVDTLRTPLQEFTGHSSVVVSADWISVSGSETPTQIITASWDRTAILWDIETKSIIQTLTGHDNELTHCSASNRLVVTSSRDSTFRLWDFR